MSRSSIVLANLTGALLERDAGTLASLVEPGGHLIVSGFMESETAVVPALEKLLTPFNVVLPNQAVLFTSEGEAMEENRERMGPPGGNIVDIPPAGNCLYASW